MQARAQFFEPFGECTVGVISGTVTADGRPMIWKNRDVFDHDQRFIYYAPYARDGIVTLGFTGDCYRSDTTRIYMGANSAGFAIMNSDSYNLNDTAYVGLDDGTLMRLALETCVTLADFERFLDSTNVTGRVNCWNYGCLDATGASAMYECANHSYVKFDPLDREEMATGFLVRANYSMSGIGNLSGFDRYKRGTDLLSRRLEHAPIDAGYVLREVVRDMANVFAVPYPLPYHGTQLNGPPGYIYNFGCTIFNRSTSSAVVIRGVGPGEDPALTTIFAILGQPALSLAFPLWVKAEAVPLFLSHPAGAPVYTYCRDRSINLYDNSQNVFHLNSRYLLNDDSGGVYSYTFPLERWGIEQAETALNRWRNEPPSKDEVIFEQFRIARALFTGFQLETSEYISDSPEPPPLPGYPMMFNYPNPFNEGTHIVFMGLDPALPTTLRIYDLLGRQVYEMNGTENGSADVYWAGIDSYGNSLSTGVYFYILNNGSLTLKNKMLLLK